MGKLTKEIERREKANELAPFPVYDTGIIKDLKHIDMITKKGDYNNVPVTYCKTCLKLHIKETKVHEQTVTYCIDCGNTDLDETHISEWEDLYKDKYGKKFLDER